MGERVRHAREREGLQGRNAAAFARGGETAVAVGDNGLAWISTGGNLANWGPTEETKTGQKLNEVVAGSGGSLFAAAGDHGAILLFSEPGGSWCGIDSRTANHLNAVAVDKGGGIAFAVGNAGERATFLKFDTAGCESPAARVEGDVPPVEASAGQIDDLPAGNRDAVDAETKFVVDRIGETLARIVAVFILLYLVHHLIGLIRYYLRLAAFYDARSDAVLMTDPEKLPLSRSVWTFERSANALTPRDIDFDNMPRSMAKEILRLARSLLRRK